MICLDFLNFIAIGFFSFQKFQSTVTSFKSLLIFIAAEACQPVITSVLVGRSGATYSFRHLTKICKGTLSTPSFFKRKRVLVSGIVCQRVKECTSKRIDDLLCFLPFNDILLLSYYTGLSPSYFGIVNNTQNLYNAFANS